MRGRAWVNPPAPGLPLGSCPPPPHLILSRSNKSRKLSLWLCVLRDLLLGKAANCTPSPGCAGFMSCHCPLPMYPATLVNTMCSKESLHVSDQDHFGCSQSVLSWLMAVAPLMLLCDPLSRPEEPPTWSGYMGKMFQAATNYLPAQVSGMMNQDRAFATVRLNISGQRNICALSTYVLTSAAPWPRQPVSRHNYLCPPPPPWPLISHPSRVAGVCCVCVQVRSGLGSRCFSH